jgi:hypothetical protein
MRAGSYVLPLSLLFSIGCSTSYEVSSSPTAASSFNAFNVEASEKKATILFQDGGELGVRNIIASPDSTRFLNAKTNEITVVPTRAIKTVVLTSAGAGFLDGLEWGAGIGAVTGVTFGLIAMGSSNSDEWGSDDAGISMGVGAIGAVAGGVIGGIIGVSVGHSYRYEFPLTKGRDQ